MMREVIGSCVMRGRSELHFNHIPAHVMATPTGSNGSDYMFLLKGHEDLRQDERVLQLFGLVNTLLSNDPETLKRHLRLGEGEGC